MHVSGTNIKSSGNFNYNFRCQVQLPYVPMSSEIYRYKYMFKVSGANGTAIFHKPGVAYIQEFTFKLICLNKTVTKPVLEMGIMVPRSFTLDRHSTNGTT